MKAFKYVVWVLLLFLVQTVVMNYITPFGFRADIILPFVIVVAIKEDKFRLSTTVSIVCAAMAGALCGKNFSFCVLFYTYAGALVFNMRKYPAYMPDFVRYILWIVPGAFVSEIISYLLLYASLERFVKTFAFHMLPAALITIVGSLIIYPLANATLYRRKKIMGRLITK